MRSAVEPSPGTSPAQDGSRRHAQAPGATSDAILVANSTIQLIDLDLDRAAVGAIAVRYFECADDGVGGDDAAVPSLHQVDLDSEGVFYHPLTGQIADPAAAYAVSGTRAMEAFAGQWLPVPVLRVGRQAADGSFLLEEGPSNWARLMVTRGNGDPACPWHVVLAIDTGLDPAGDDGGRSATAPVLEDIRRSSTFALSADVEAIGWFVNEPWVDEWLIEAFRETRPAAEPSAGPAAADTTVPGGLAYLAHYLTLLAAVNAAGRVPRVHLVAPPAGGEGRFVPVDLILDLGASRTAALLAETAPGAPLSIGRLPLRDLSDLDRTDSGIFPSRVEFARPDFGKDVYSRWSGRSAAFFWPSLVRTGGEARRLASAQPASDALTGLSSPMPYVWDDRASRNLWRFAGATPQAGRRQPLVSGPLLAHLTETGDVQDAGATGTAATKPRFSRASMLTFLATELVLHAVSAANSLAWRRPRAESALPRRLVRIILTLPATVEAAEAAQTVARVEAAVRLLWSALGWSRPGRAHVFSPPAVELSADTATAAQLAFLENEITHKFGGKARQYFDLVGRSRNGRGTARGMRLATLDIGGSSTGLAVRAWRLDETGGLASDGLLVEGFPLGGDDVARALVERLVLPALARRLADCRIADPQRLLASLLGGDGQAPTTRQDELRRRFAAEIALPVAIRLLAESDISATARDAGPAVHVLGDLLSEPGRGGRPSPGASSLAEEIEAIAADEGADSFELMRTEIAAGRPQVAAIARSVLQPALACATRAIGNLGCDRVLITGWLSRLPVVAEALLESVPLRPDRIQPVGQYRVADWYPDRSEAGTIADPKSMAAVGAVLASRLAPVVGGLAVRNPGNLARRQETRCFVGPILADGRIADDAVLFEPGGAASGRDEAGKTLRATLAGEPPFVLGWRRAPLESWPALPLFRLELAEMAADARPKLPLRITLGWQGSSVGGAGQPIVLRALDADGIDLAPGEIEMRPSTLGAEDGHWLDTGHFRVDCPMVAR